MAGKIRRIEEMGIEMFEFGEMKPEDAGIPASAVKKMEELFEEQEVNIHGYMLLSGKKILAEKYYKHWEKEKLHRIFSVTKTYVAFAVGILLKKGMISLDDKICDYFPEMLPEGGAHTWCQEMTIRDMLKMQTCYAKTTYKGYDAKGDWTKTFFIAKPDHICGTVFNYDTSSAHVLGALVEKLTGMELTEFLRKEAFEKVGFSKEAYCMKDPVGVSQGGSGMMCTMRDMAGVAYLANHFGNVDGEQLIPEEFMREAVCNLTPTDLQPVLDEQCGYGYFIWMPRVHAKPVGKNGNGGEYLSQKGDNDSVRTGLNADTFLKTDSEEGFVMYGMGGQLAVCFPKYDFCYITMADTIGNGAGLQILYDCFYHTVYPYLRDGKEKHSAIISPKDTAVAENEEHEKEESGVYAEGRHGDKIWIYNPEKKKNAVQNYTFYENSHGWQKVTFDFKEKCVTLNYVDADKNEKELRLLFDLEKEVLCRPFSDNDCECAVNAYFKLGHFFLKSFMVDEEMGHVNMEFAWKDEKRMSVRMAATNEPFYANLKGTAAAYKE